MPKPIRRSAVALAAAALVILLAAAPALAAPPAPRSPAADAPGPALSDRLWYAVRDAWADLAGPLSTPFARSDGAVGEIGGKRGSVIDPDGATLTGTINSSLGIDGERGSVIDPDG